MVFGSSAVAHFPGPDSLQGHEFDDSSPSRKGSKRRSIYLCTAANGSLHKPFVIVERAPAERADAIFLVLTPWTRRNASIW
jgi:hypothetical protein